MEFFIPGVPPYGPRPRCDWFAPSGSHPFAGDRCYYNNSHDGDFALLDGRIFPAYTNENDELNWPVHELFFENYGCPPTNEYTIHQNIAPAAAVYGFITSAGGELLPNREPEVTASVTSARINQGEDVSLVISANDSDGWIYQTRVYLNNRLVKKINGNPGTFDFKILKPGSGVIKVVVNDNLGLSAQSEEIVVEVDQAENMPVCEISNLQEWGLYRDENPINITADAIGDNIVVTFYNYNEIIGEADEPPYQVEWTPGEPGLAEIRAVAEDIKGLNASDLKYIKVTSSCFNLVKPSEGERLDPGTSLILEALPESCPGDIKKVAFFISGLSSREDTTASPADGSFGVSIDLDGNGSYSAYAIAYLDNENYISDTIHFSMDFGSGVGSDKLSSLLTVYPNPSSDGFYFRPSGYNSIYFSIEIFDADGKFLKKIIADDKKLKNQTELFWDASNQNPGIYFYRCISDNRTQEGKLFLMN